MWICPTLGRPGRLGNLASSWTEKKPLLVVLTVDDPRYEEYVSRSWPASWQFLSVKEKFLVPKLNLAFGSQPDADFYGFIADDVRIESPSVLTKLEALAEGWFLSYPNDTIHGKDLGTHFCVGGSLAREMGWMAHPSFRHYYIDNVWKGIGLANGIYRYAPDVIFHHEHPIKVPSMVDEIYSSTYLENWKMDSEIWEKYIRTKGQASRDATQVFQALRRAFPV
jgi:hypothetical protein